MLKAILTVFVMIAILIWEFLYALWQWVIVVAIIIGFYRGCMGEGPLSKHELPPATILETALSVPPRSIWMVRRADCAFYAPPSWADVERGLRRQQGSFHVVETGAKGFSIQFDETKQYVVFFFAAEDCEKARIALKQNNAWTPRK